MSCERYLDLISARLDGELTGEESAALTAHLQECPACRAIARDMEGLHSAISGLGQVDAPAELSVTVMSKIKAERSAVRRRFVRRISSLAACLVLCVGAWQLIRPHAPEDVDGVPNVARHVQPLDLTDVQPVSNQQRFRLSDMATTLEPSAVLLDSTDALSRCLSCFSGAGLSAVAESYGEEYFRTHRLLAVVVQEPSSSITHTISTLTADNVTILRNVPEAGDCDMALWLILAEVEGKGPETPLAVELLTN